MQITTSPAESLTATENSNAVWLLDIAASGFRAAVSVGGTVLPCTPEEGGFAPRSLVTVLPAGAASSGALRLPAFPTLLERLGETGRVSMEDVKPDVAHQQLQHLLSSVTAGLSKWWGRTSASLGILVPTYATEPQRDLIARAAQNAGWQDVHLINKTTALAAHALADVPDGNYLVGVFGHGPADMSIVQCRSSRIRPLTHLSVDRISGAQLDRELLAGSLSEVLRKAPDSLDVSLFSDLDWLWLRQKVELARHRLSAYESVTLDLPSALTDGPAVQLSFERSRALSLTESVVGDFDAVLKQCCEEADIATDDIDGCLVCGGLLRQAGFLDYLKARCGSLPVVPYSSETPLHGARRRVLAVRQNGPSASPEPATSASLPAFENYHVPDDTAGDSVEAARKRTSADSIIQRVTDLIRAGQVDQARSELQPLKEYLRAFDLSLATPEQALGSLLSNDAYAAFNPPRTTPAVTASDNSPDDSSTSASSVSLSGPPVSVSQPPVKDTMESSPKKETAPSQPVDKKAESRQERFKYIRAKDEIKNAQKAIGKGELAQAVSLSHIAYETSDDPRIFEAMIKVHLIAASKRPPKPGTFPEDRRWLQCALNDDRTREDTQQALCDRYMTHVRQLVDMRTDAARQEAVKTLKELSGVTVMPELAETWLVQLKSTPVEEVQLPEQLPDADSEDGDGASV